jgi:hypothetical protein
LNPAIIALIRQERQVPRRQQLEFKTPKTHIVVGKFSLLMLCILARPKRIPHVPYINSGHNKNEHLGPQASLVAAWTVMV